MAQVLANPLLWNIEQPPAYRSIYPKEDPLVKALKKLAMGVISPKKRELPLILSPPRITPLWIIRSPRV
jgi:hypothetical protein